MIKVNYILMTTCLFAIATCDLLGYNRLGNNVYRNNIFSFTRDDHIANVPYGLPIVQKILEGYRQAAGEDQQMIRNNFVSAQARPVGGKFNRLNRYKRRMMSN